MNVLKFSIVPRLSIVAVLVFCTVAQAKQKIDTVMSISDVGALLAGRYENTAQVIEGSATSSRPPQHRSITIEPTQKAQWELWRIHMDVDPAVAESAGSATSLDAVWAMNISPREYDCSLSLIPYIWGPAVNAATLDAAAFNQAQWLSLEACMLRDDFGKSRITAQVAGDEMCVVEVMGLGGQRAFLPS